MKKLVRLLAVVLSVAMLAGCSLVTINPEKIVVATVREDTISKAEFDEELNALLSYYGYTQDSAEVVDGLEEVKQDIIDQMVERLVIEQKKKEINVGVLTEEEQAAAIQDVQDWYDEQLNELIAEYQKDETVDDPETTARQAMDNYLSYYGTDFEGMKKSEVQRISDERLFDYITKDVTVTEEEAKLAYAERVSEAKEEYDADLNAFVSDKQFGSLIYYTPEGCFYVKHILIKLTDEQQQEIKDLRADDDETVAATADAKREEMLAGIREKAEEVLALVNAGGDFDALMAEYGEDPGMQSDLYKETGYLTYAGDTGFVEEFATACEGLTADGMTTGLVASDYGYHIIRRVSTLEAGETPFEEIQEDLMAELLSDAQNEYYNKQVEEWVAAANPEIKSNKL